MTFSAVAAEADVTCAPNREGAKILRTPDFNDIHPQWRLPNSIGTSWSLIRMSREGVFLRGQLVSPRGGIQRYRVFVIASEWTCSEYIPTEDTVDKQQISASKPKIEGVWIEETAQCGIAGNNEVRISPSQIVGNEWGCAIIEGKITSTRWELKARCNEDGEYDRPGDQVPISRVIIYLQHGRLTMAGNKPLSVNGSRTWRWEYGHRCGE